MIQEPFHFDGSQIQTMAGARKSRSAPSNLKGSTGRILQAWYRFEAVTIYVARLENTPADFQQLSYFPDARGNTREGDIVFWEPRNSKSQCPDFRGYFRFVTSTASLNCSMVSLRKEDRTRTRKFTPIFAGVAPKTSASVFGGPHLSAHLFMLTFFLLSIWTKQENGVAELQQFKIPIG